MKLINRQTYLERIAGLVGRNLIVCITGQRRVGKSCLMRTLAQEWGGQPDANVIYIDKEKSEFSGLRNSADLNVYIDAKAVTHR